jgi:hypothetical protein
MTNLRAFTKSKLSCRDGRHPFMDPTSPFQEYVHFEQIGHAGREQEGGVDLARMRILKLFGAMVLA